MNDYKHTIRFTDGEQRILLFGARLYGYNTVPAFIKAIALNKLKAVPSKIKSIKRSLERKLNKLETTLGGKSQAMKSSEYQDLFQDLVAANAVHEEYAQLVSDNIQVDPIRVLKQASSHLQLTSS